MKMNLQPLFEAQRVLDERIIKEKGLEGQDLLPNKLLALQVELGELANEWRGFKHWSNDREPRTYLQEDEEPCPCCSGNGNYNNEPCFECEGTGDKIRNPMLEEYVDCLHFILSIGLALSVPELYGYEFEYNSGAVDYTDITLQFILVIDLARCELPYTHAGNWHPLFEQFVGLGEKLGFTWEQTEVAYFDKNKVNHQRQESGY